jgi:transposase InsO family protein
VREACAALDVSESGFYAHRRKEQRPWRQQDKVISGAIKEVFERNYGCYGSPRLVRALRQQGVHCGKTRLRRLMRQEGLCPRQKRRVRPRTTRCDPHRPCASHLVAALPPVDAPRQRFHSDITYIPTKEGFLYLAATVDVCSRHGAGWCARDNMETQLVKDAASMAFASASALALASASERVHHSDRGSQYASEGFRLLLVKEKIAQSMSRKGNCYDNALGESFWAKVKTECFDNFRSGIPQTKAQAMTALFRYIELFYNRERLHLALDYRSPVQFEQDWTDLNFTDNVST